MKPFRAGSNKTTDMNELQAGVMDCIDRYGGAFL